MAQGSITHPIGKGIEAISKYLWSRYGLAGRLATTVKKQFILAIVYTEEKSIKFVGFDWWKA